MSNREARVSWPSQEERRNIPNPDEGWKHHRREQAWPNPWEPDVVMECRLLFSEYSRDEAINRCKAIHGRLFDGIFPSGRYWVFYSKTRGGQIWNC